MCAAEPNVLLSSLDVAAFSFLVDNFQTSCDCAGEGVSGVYWIWAGVAGSISTHAEICVSVSVRRARPGFVFLFLLDFAAVGSGMTSVGAVGLRAAKERKPGSWRSAAVFTDLVLLLL